MATRRMVLLGADDRSRDRRAQVVPQPPPGRDHVARAGVRDLDVHACARLLDACRLDRSTLRQSSTAYPSGAAGVRSWLARGPACG